ncbi:hypothetical protein [Desulfurella sp.]|uniref:hypothetical protein n=1 Tax=Desulfurella sp. TaxID=1962857 RepID=UPI0025C5CAE0|nr:hypothetical protein [Desulfurella sp.]
MEIQARINGKIMKGEVIDISSEELLGKGYGEKLGKKIVLEPYEMLYLLEKKTIAVKNTNSQVNPAEFLKQISFQRQGFSKYLVYKDLRDRGYVVKEGIEPFYSFRLFEKGTFSTSPAKYRILIINEGDDIRVDKLKNYIISSVTQERGSMVAVVDRRGEIIYYKSFLITSGSKIE